MTADIDLNGLLWTPIANTLSVVFAGNLDGQGYAVSNVAIGSESAPLESNVFGLFGTTEGKISNLHLNTVSIHGIAMKASGRVIGLAGGLIGSASGNVENCHVKELTMTMTMTSDSNWIAAYWIGGLVGASEAEQIDECSVSGKIAEESGKGSIGGLIGELGETSKITYSRANVTLNVKADSEGGADVGGFIGKGNGDSNAETVIRNCYATGKVTGGAYTGGFAGSIWGLNIKNCYATGDVSEAAASMASFAGTDAAAGYAYGSIINCYATGKVADNAPNLYAFAMQDATQRSEITNCYFSDANSSLKNPNESATAKPLDEMKTDSFADVLNAGDKSNGWVFVNGEALGGAEPADYSAIEKALKTVPSDLTVYTDESVAALNEAIDGVIQGKAAVNQADVDAMAKAIEDAIATLQYKGADYRAVDAAIAKANALNKNEYKDFSAVEAAVRAVVRGKPLSEQAAVDAMAKAIEDAITALEKKPVEMTVQLPQTGDDSNLALWTALLLVSGAAIGAMMAGKKKNYGK